MNKTTEERLMVERVKVENLYGRFHYDIKFDPVLNIITGPNGFGKGTILKFIKLASMGANYMSDFAPTKSLDEIYIKFNKSMWARTEKDKNRVLGSIVVGAYKDKVRVLPTDIAVKTNVYLIPEWASDQLVNCFIDTINSQLCAFRKCKVDSDRGRFIFIDVDSNEEIILGDSETRIMQLLYHFVFTSNDYDIIIFDHPEDRLHPYNSTKLIDDILKFRKDRQIIVLTQSPDIVNGREMLDLGEMYREQEMASENNLS